MSALPAVRLVLTLAWRSLRGGRDLVSGFGVFLACLVLGVGAVSCVGFLSASVQATLARDARVLLGGDIVISQVHLPPSAEAEAFLRQHGQTARTQSLRAMLRPEAENATRRSLLVELKAVDPAYPLVGEVTLASGRPLAQAFLPVEDLPGLVLERAALRRLGLAVGDVAILGARRFRVADVLIREPDRPASFLGLGPRALLPLAELDATGLVQPGSVVTHALLARLDSPEAAAKAGDLLTELKARHGEPGWRVRGLNEASPGLSRFFDTFSRYLTLVGLASLLVGGIGVASGVRGYLAREDGVIATLKCLGATRAMVSWVYLTQLAALALLGGALGCLAGLLAALALEPLLQNVMDLPVTIVPHWRPALTALAHGLLTSLAFGVWPVSAAGRVSPARLFRGYAEAAPRSPSWKAGLGALLCGGLLVLLTLQDSVSQRVTLGFFGGVAATMLLFRLFGHLLMAVARRLPRPRDPRRRQALANLHRPGASTPAVVFSLGLGLTILAAISLVDGNLQHAISSQFPSQAPAFFFLDVQHTQIEQFRELARKTPGIVKTEDEPSLRGRIVRINGVPVENATIGPDADWAVRGDRGLTFAATQPPHIRLVAGEWWPADHDGPPLMCLDAGIAKGFGVKVGDTLAVSVLGREITAAIAALRVIDWGTMALNHAIIFSPNTLRGAPHGYIATAYADPAAPGAEEALFDAVTAAFPNVVAIGVKDVLADVARLTATLGLAVRGAGLVTVLAGILVLAESLRANLDRRRREAVVFKVLGATRRDVLLTLGWEFLLLGTASAAVAACLGAAMAWLFTDAIMRTQFVLLWRPLLACLASGVLATTGLGLWAVRAALGKTAWGVLRNE